MISRHRLAAKHTLPTRNRLLNAYWRLYNTHPHNILPLESALPVELQPRSRDQYRTVMAMILSPGTADRRLSVCLGRLFRTHPSFDSCNDLVKDQVERILDPVNNGGIGLGDPRGGNTDRLWAVLSCYFGPWKDTLTPENTRGLLRKEGFGPETLRLLDAYCWGNRDVLPLNRAAFNALVKRGLYEQHGDIDVARADVESKLAGEEDVVLIDFHEMLRFRDLYDSKSENEQKNVVIGWNAWRLLCSTERERIREDWRWINEHLVKDEDIAQELWRFFRKIADP